MSYQSILGHQRPKELLKQSLKRHRLHHAYLFWGPPGVGKRSMARAFAQALNCSQPQAGEACGLCSGCQKIAKGHHPDLLSLEVEAGKTYIGIKQIIEQLQPFMAYRPYEGLRKVALIGEAHMMTEDAANALLKTLEEPPPLSHLILTAPSPFALLPTVVSRCQTLSFAPLPLALVEKELERRLKISPQSASLMASLAEGSLGAALEFDPQGLLNDRAQTVAAWEAMEKGRLSEAQDLAEKWGKDRGATKELLRLLILWHRDLLALSYQLPSPLLFNRDEIKNLQTKAGQQSSYEWLRRLILLRRAFEAAEANANTKLLWGALFVEIREGIR